MLLRRFYFNMRGAKLIMGFCHATSSQQPEKSERASGTKYHSWLSSPCLLPMEI